MAVTYGKAPAWLAEFKRREAAGDKTIRPALLHEWQIQAGINPTQGKAILNGMPLRGDTIDRVAEWVLELPNPELFRTCDECSWADRERWCNEENRCPVCGSNTSRIKPDF